MKFYPPLGNKVHRVTQTYHGEDARNPNDLSKQMAIDISATKGTPVYAVADGTIVNATANAGGYCTLDCGLPYWILYVHTMNWLPIGTKVKRGQKIAVLNDFRPNHLHLGFKMKDGTPPRFGLMETVDRSTVFGVGFTKGSASYNAILKAWFISDLKIDWSRFIDIDPFYTPTKGDRYEIMSDTNIRTGPSTSRGINGLAKKGAVGEIKQTGMWYADTYSWVFLNFGNIEGYGIIKNMRRTEKSKTFSNGTPIVPPVIPPDCEEEKERLNSELSGVRFQIAELTERLEKAQGDLGGSQARVTELEELLGASEERGEALEVRVEQLKNRLKVWEGEAEEMGRFRQFISWLKSIWKSS